MKLLSLFTCLVLIYACQQAPARYSTDSPEIDLAKSAMDAYLAGDWETMRSAFADTATIYHNNNEGIGPDENITSTQESLAGISSYELEDETYWEMIVDDENRKWVYFWGTWIAQHQATGSTLEVPFHIAWWIQDNKIVEEYGYWDNTSFVLADQEAAAQASAKEEATAEESSN